MNELLNSKLFTDLKDGKLPEVEVTIKTETLVQIGIVVFLAAVAATLAGTIIRAIGK